jgi:RHS repeat-associated protein
LAVCATLLHAAAPASAAAGGPPSPSHTKPVPVTPVVSHYHQPRPTPKYRAPAVAWPSGHAEVSLAPPSSGATGRTAGHRQPTASVRAGELPVRLRRVAASASAHHAGILAPANPALPANPSAVGVDVLTRAQARAAGVNGVLLSLTDDSGPSAAGAGVGVTVDYGSFASAFGGDWASRLRLVSLPSCALTTPQVPACRRETPVVSSNDTATHTLSSDDVQLPTSSAAKTVSSVAGPQVTLLAADSSAGGGGGDFSATSLKPSGSWQAGGSSDAFGWSYPIGVPSVPGGLTPVISLDYNSQSQDGLTSSTNNQASLIGDGFDYDPGFIERSYQSCDQNPAGATKTEDNCWSNSNTLTMSLGGHSSVLIKDDSTGDWHPQDDANERIQYKTGAVNGAQNGEYWVITTDNGTQYYFGLNQLPGYVSGDTATNSVWTEPVYATASGQPCYNATFANSWCQQAYRWNLDYVVDAHQDAISYFYTTDTGYYARDLGTTANTPYTRGGYPNKIMYGQRAGQVYSTSPAGQVLFTVNGRCDTSATGCATSTLTSTTAKDWPDVPYDLQCAQNASCSVDTPTFWTKYELTGIQTQALVGTTETNVDSWALTHGFPATGDSTTPALWLSTITRTGQDTSGGGSTSALSLPAVTLSGTPLSNRVDLTDGYPPITRHRLNTITTETGEIIDVAYSAPACATGTPSDPSQNTRLCYPAYWTPAGSTAPVEDWFNKYIVTGVTEQDPTGGGVNDTIAAHYTPVGTPAWHYDDNPLTSSNQRTWNQFRGYQGMKVTTGSSPDPVTETDYTYFRGMDGDTLPGGQTRSATVSDSRGDTAVTDLDQYAGSVYETVQYNGAGSGTVVKDTVTDPWTSAARATHSLGSSLPAQRSYLTGQSRERVFTPFSNGNTGQTETDYAHDSYGRVTKTDDLGDVTTATDDRCATVNYADNTTAWILDTPDENTTVSVNCSTTPTYPKDAVSDTRTFYDGSTTFGAAPTAGTVTMTQNAASYSGSTPSFVTMSSSTVDQYGRVLTGTDADNRTTHTAYTPATGAQPTSVTVTDPLTHTTTTTYDPLRELDLTTTDAGGYVTTKKYDALGRLTADYKPGVTSAYETYSYTVSNQAPSVVTTQTLNQDNTYRTSEVLYDALLRKRETQSSTMDGGRDVTDTVYNTDGLTASSSDPYYTTGAPSGTLVQAQAGDIPSETGYLYDGAGRQTAAVSYKLGTETWRTTTSYGGNVTTTVPPKGGVAQSTLTDARGNATDLYQYHTGVPADPVGDPASDYSATHYTYDADGNRTGETDAAGNSWSWAYDLLGNETSQTDPDTGTNTSTYDNAGQLLTVTDARGKQTTYTYDLDGRKTFAYDTTGNATPASTNEIGAWTYDTLKKGYPTASTSYQKGTTSPSVTHTILAYTSLAKVSAERETLANLPANEAALAPSGGYVTGYTYKSSGWPASKNIAAAGGLASEIVNYGYDQYGDPTGLASTAWNYVGAVGYDEYGKPLQYTLGTSGTWVALNLSYDEQTQRLTDAKTTDATASTVVDDTKYTYSGSNVSGGAGLLTSTTDSQNGGAVSDTQCFGYDYATRLSAAWTATDACAATPAPGSSSTVGGPQPYWQSWTYDAAGNRQTQTDHDTGGNTANDTVTTYAYPAAGSASDQPHTLTRTTATGPGATAHTASYAYDASGNDTSLTTQSGTQTLTWNDQDKLGALADTATGGTTSYLYDSDGNLALRTDPGKATLFLGDQEVVENTGTGTLSDTRYYTIGTTTIAERSSTGDIQYLIPDRQGTDTLAIDYQSLAVTRRAYLPFGADRGTAPASWPGDKGYVGGTPDAATGLENLGAREYDPSSGRFLSPDPVFEASDPTQLGGYDYAGNDPVTDSDPTGLCPADLCGVGTPKGDGSGAIIQVGPVDPTDPGGPTENHGHYYQNGHRVSRLQALTRLWSDYLTGQYYLTHPLPKPHHKHKSWYKRGWDDFTKDTSKAAKIAYHYSGASDVVGCVSDPSLGGCSKAAALAAGFVLTGGEDELEIAALEAGEDAADSAATDAADEAVSCLAPHSFTGTTEVLEADGHTEAIKDVKAGDKVLATDPQTGETSPHTVQKVIKTTTDHDFTNLTITTPGQAGAHRSTHKSAPAATLTTTWHHPFWDATTHQWTEASHLIPGTRLRQPDGTPAIVTAVRNYHTTAVTYDLTITDLHSYYVLAGATPVLVHNCNIKLSQEQADVLDLGPYADETTPVEATGPTVEPAQSDAMQGQPCHSCGDSPEGQTMVGDHQPATSLSAPGTLRMLYPQCPACSSLQARAVQIGQRIMRNHGWYNPETPGYLDQLRALLPGHVG